jgi:hypothetical protein
MENKGGITMMNWKLTSLILTILLGISIMWSVQQPANFEKLQLKHYSLEHAQLTLALQNMIEEYEENGNQKELGEQLLRYSGFMLNIRPVGETAAYRMFDFDYDIHNVLFEVHRKARGDQIKEHDIERLKTAYELLKTFEDLALNNVEHKTVDDYENDFDQFLEHYETKKHDLVK